ncbi:MAG: VanZ family protein [Clostridia bacterium]|nr:VanZ family protein [Clostridia bacterium]
MLKRAIFAILIIINCIVIFVFSSENSTKSNQTSGVVVERVVTTISKVNKKVKKETLRDKVTFYVRKTAHFSIYTLLGVWLMNEANTFDISTKRKIILCIVFGALYAITDEFHQSFVSGRSMEIRDMCIDTCGVLFGCLLVMLAGKVINLIKSKNKETA